MEADLQIQLGRLALPNPVLVAAGTFGYGLEFSRHVRLDSLGGIVTKTITLKARQGNPPPRLIETPAGMLNAVGLHNVGLEAFLRNKLPELSGIGVPIIVSILGELRQEVEAMCSRLDAERGVSAIELNLSCPNLNRSGLRAQGSGPDSSQPTAPNPEPILVAQDADATFAFVQAARQHTSKLLIAKLSPDVTDPRPIAQAAMSAGADALALVNTFRGMSIDPYTLRSRLGSLTGGLSGPAVRPLALYRVWLIHKAMGCPIIGMGGIVRAEDAIEFFLAGATAVAVGTANFSCPDAALRVLRGIRRYLKRRRIDSIRQIVGALAEDGLSS